MSIEPEIRKSTPGDAKDIEKLYAAAFPDEDLLPLVRDLLGEEQGVLSLVALSENAILGHICFTACHIEGRGDEVALLGPLAVTPPAQKQGVASALVRTGFDYLQKAKTGYVFVLGDPAYYARFGFEADDKVTPPYQLPAEWHGAWQSMKLPGATAPLEGKLVVPAPWRQPSLWSS